MQYAKYSRLFENPEDFRALPEHQPWDHEINLKEGKNLPTQKLRRHRYDNTRTLEEYAQMALKKGWLRPSKSPVASNMHVAYKKDDPKGRPCGDFRELNEATIRDQYPLPNAQYLRDKLAKAKKFTKLDQRSAFNLIRIKEGHEWMTAVLFPSGLYEHTVMPFGLMNAPATCQRQNDNILREYLGKFVICYLDDILVYSENDEDHETHVKLVLDALLKVDSRLKLSKCEFGVIETLFLGYVIRPGQMSIDPEKIQRIKDWPEPQNVTDVQSFLGFGNFCRQFIGGYSEITTPLSQLTRKGVLFLMGPKEKAAMEELKKRFTEEPVIHSFFEDRPSILQTDASDTCSGAVHLQPDENGKLHPVAYYSEKHSPAEQNYDIYEKELMAGVKALRHWKIYLLGAKFPVTWHTDHMNLRGFMTTKVLDNRRLARWAEELSHYDLVIKHIPGKDNVIADALSRQPGYEGDKVYKDVAILKEDENGNLVQNIKAIALTRVQGPWDEDIRKAQGKTSANADYQNGKLVVPEGFAKEFIQKFHEAPAHGHQGSRRTLGRIKQHYHIDKAAALVKEVVKECDICIRNKAARHAPYGLMGTTPIPGTPWKSVQWDFIVKLPPSRDPMTGVVYDSILVIVERLTKYMVCIPYKESSSAEELSFAFLREVVAHHGMPEEIISDRDKLFTSKFWTALTAYLGVKRKLSTAFHPQTNGGTERMNQVIEAYLRCYVNYKQDNWVSLLPLAQFAYNSSITDTTKVSPFYANFGYELSAYNEPHSTNIDNQLARTQADEIKELHKELAEELRFVAEKSALYYNAKRSQEPTLKEGDKVYLLRRNIKTQRPSDKLDHKKLGPSRIKQVKGRLNYELALPKNMNIFPVFHVSLLEKAPLNAPPAPETPIQPINPEAEYEVEEILDHKLIRNKLHFLVHWKGYPQSERTWEPRTNLNCPEPLKAYQQKRRVDPGLPRTQDLANRNRNRRPRHWETMEGGPLRRPRTQRNSEKE